MFLKVHNITVISIYIYSMYMWVYWCLFIRKSGLLSKLCVCFPSAELFQSQKTGPTLFCDMNMKSLIFYNIYFLNSY